MFVSLHLTQSEAEYLKARMRLTAMNEPGTDHIHACTILHQLDTKYPALPRREYSSAGVDQFADLFPVGGRE